MKAATNTIKNLGHNSKFKVNYELENYLLLRIDKKEITTFAKLRISDSKLMIEQGRHKQLPIENRLCPLCKPRCRGIDLHHILILVCSLFAMW